MIKDIIAKGDKVVFRQIKKATHKGEFEGLPTSELLSPGQHPSIDRGISRVLKIYKFLRKTNKVF